MQRDEGEQLGHVGLALEQGLAASGGAHGTEQAQLRQPAGVGEPRGDVLVQAGVGVLYVAAHRRCDPGREGLQVLGRRGGRLQVLLVGSAQDAARRRHTRSVVAVVRVGKRFPRQGVLVPKCTGLVDEGPPALGGLVVDGHGDGVNLLALGQQVCAPLHLVACQVDALAAHLAAFPAGTDGLVFTTPTWVSGITRTLESVLGGPADRYGARGSAMRGARRQSMPGCRGSCSTGCATTTRRC